jgi:hypothetical protein
MTLVAIAGEGDRNSLLELTQNSTVAQDRLRGRSSYCEREKQGIMRMLAYGRTL